jgi:hypothetical protein
MAQVVDHLPSNQKFNPQCHKEKQKESRNYLERRGLAVRGGQEKTMGGSEYDQSTL